MLYLDIVKYGRGRMKTIRKGTTWLLTTLILLSSVGMIGCSSSNSNTSASATLEYMVHDSEIQESQVSEKVIIRLIEWLLLSLPS